MEPWYGCPLVVGESFEIGGDGILRTLRAVDADARNCTGTFSPTLSGGWGDQSHIIELYGVVEEIPTEDFHYADDSPVINTGDPAVLDVDGSRSDMGAYGGPHNLPPCD